MNGFQLKMQNNLRRVTLEVPVAGREKTTPQKLPSLPFPSKNKNCHTGHDRKLEAVGQSTLLQY